MKVFSCLTLCALLLVFLSRFFLSVCVSLFPNPLGRFGIDNQLTVKGLYNRKP